jgi:sigma-B regulation protein RsbU (phosphoserine phosphatase)
MEIAIHDSEKRLRGELANVRNIQAAMLPDFSRVTGYDIASIFLPAEDLSGDFFDGYFIDEDVFQIVICDVMHHGMTSAYLGMEIRSLFRAYSGPEISPSRAIESVNRKLCEDFSEIMYYATVAVCQIRIAEGILVYSSGGHPPSLYLPAGENEIRETGFTGALIGLRKGNVYEEITVEMNAGDSILLYTDGVTETRQSGNGDMFGRTRLGERFIAVAGETSREIIHGLLENVFEFSDFSSLEDDMTMICIKRKG